MTTASRSTALLAGFLLFAAAVPLARAAEGMWFPPQLPELAGELRAAGLEVDPASLSRLTEHPMAAVISLGGCSASFVSPRGLIVTNHHCVYGTLQYNSTETRDLIDRGFLAAKPEDELQASPGSRVYVAERVEDVTERVLRGLDEITDGAERFETIEKREKEVIAECERQPGRRCKFYSFYGGLEFHVVRYLELRDVRLVYAPADGVGRFGGDTDNWMWPRHTGDFGFYRAYVGPDGNPADPSPDNVPYAPAYHLRLAPQGIAEDDFVMVIGYPGRTARYRLSSEVESRFGWYYPHARRVYRDALALIERFTANDPEVRIKYAGTVSGMNNAMKNYDGMMAGYGRSDMLGRKRRQEARVRAWIDADPGRRREYGRAMEELNDVLELRRAARESDFALSRLNRTAMLSSARRLVRLSHERVKPDTERKPGYQERDMTFIRQRLERIDRRFDPEVDRALLGYSLTVYEELPESDRVPEIDAAFGLRRPGADVDAGLRAMYERTQLDEPDVRLALMDATPEQLERSEDPFIRLALALYDGDLAREADREALEGRLQRLRAHYMRALVIWLRLQGRPVYSDANGSLRVTYGQVRGYSPRDGVFYLPFTRMEGLLAKATGKTPFAVPQDLLLAVDRHRSTPDGAQYIRSLPVNFLSTVDTTGGNSGSATLNGRGELVGLLFDGTWDSINADWDFNEASARSIHADVRYMLWVMEQVDGAKGLLDEMGL